MRTITCDRCGATIDKGVKPWAFAICDSNTGEPYPGNPFKEWDFCLECKDEIIDFMKSKPAKPKPGAILPRRALDKGKIRALRKAGWTIMEIAKEMGCSSSSVSKILSEKEEQHEDNG